MDTGFFKWVWRFNALAIAGLVIFIGAIAVWEIFPKPRNVSGVVNVDPADETLVETLRIGNVTPINGLIRYSVGREQTYDVGYSSSGKSTRNNTVNYGFLDPSTGDVRWLLEGFDALILETYALRQAFPVTDLTDLDSTDAQAMNAVNLEAQRAPGSSDKGDEKLVGTLFLIVDQDTSGDNRLSRSDIGRIAVSLPDGTALKEILQDVRTGLKKLDKTRELIRFTDGEGDKIAILNLETRAVESLLMLPLK